ncbi:hypothetical protein RJ639_038135 [Escallonia herrerae]|uniref:Condensin complex subunit 2 n=1 Tax=Escallonia herrerae TaxID=1293975 RepID=A0AA88WLG0_9ASTE|nr:hypothetical protein RJ639_038135 [Escallonia herrerae]
MYYLFSRPGRNFHCREEKWRKETASSCIDFTKSLDQKVPDIFAPPKNPKSLLLPDKRLPWESILPEDCYFQPEDLTKLFLLPNIMCYGKKRKFLGPGETSWPRNNTFGEQVSSWDNESVFGGQSDGSVCGDLDDSVKLVSQPHQVAKIEVQYDKTAKQVDVHVLKETLWDHIKDTQVPEMVCKNAISFKRVLATFSLDYQAAVLEDVSPHLCFICLLHLANERALSISDFPTLDDLSIYLPSSSGNA